MGSLLSSRAAAAAALLALLAGCDAGPGASRLEERPPTVSELVFSPSLIDITVAGSPFQVENGLVTVPFSVQVGAEDPDGEVAEVIYTLNSVTPGVRVSVGTMAPQSTGLYAASVELKLSVAEPGRYPVIVYAIDKSGRLSNEVRGALELRSAGGPPAIEAAQASAEEGEIVLTAAVTDPEGAGNVAQVEARSGSGTLTILRDDGDTFFSGKKSSSRKRTTT